MPVQGDSKSGFEEYERIKAEWFKKMDSYKKKAELYKQEQEAKRKRNEQSLEEQERIRKYGLQQV